MAHEFTTTAGRPHDEAKELSRGDPTTPWVGHVNGGIHDMSTPEFSFYSVHGCMSAVTYTVRLYRSRLRDLGELHSTP